MQALKPVSIFIIAATLVGCSDNDISTSNSKIATVASTASATAQPATAGVQSADPLARGAKLYKRCVSCHSLEEGGRHKVGPNLWELFGSTAGTREGFAYSKAMKASALIWDEDTLNGYIENPREYMPGNRMSYVGLRKAEDREALLAYLKRETSPK
ncbi:MAG: c-type cytochrome [Maricaulaceae bacterium]